MRGARWRHHGVFDPVGRQGSPLRYAALHPDDARFPPQRRRGIKFNKMSLMRPTATKELRYVNFKEYYFGFVLQHDYRFFYRL
jgi:hypothetical protein